MHEQIYRAERGQARFIPSRPKPLILGPTNSKNAHCTRIWRSRGSVRKNAHTYQTTPKEALEGLRMGLFASLRSPEEPLGHIWAGLCSQFISYSSTKEWRSARLGARARFESRSSRAVQPELAIYIYWMVRGRANFLEYPRASLRSTNPDDQGC